MRFPTTRILRDPNLPSRRRTASPPHFLNVDLEIVSRRDLALLAAALGRDVYVLHAARSRGRHRLALEVSDVSIVDPRACIAEFVALVSALPRTAKTLWTTAERRRFDIGFDAGATNAVLDADTVRAVARVG
ncbi:MAG TPA: hypothetical protein VIF62_05890, partial [Labilithrix sp.]